MKDNINENIIDVEISEEMKQSYIDYAMSVITDRALPDVRDGLKPVHRRILYAMHELGLAPNTPHRKCARIVGDVLGKFHPHSDDSVYDALVKLAQDFYIRMPLVDGHGNFGSIDGDSPASMRYTEAKMSKIATEMLRDINKNSVNFIPNFDESEQEPSVLPSRFPNLLVNGAFGIAVGMATNIPPHNITEAINAVVYTIDNPECTIKDLIKYIPSPDFPTGAYIINQKDMEQIYSSGSGAVVLRGSTNIEDIGGGKKQIVITEIPYQVNKTKLIESIVNLVRNKKVAEVSEIRDESDKSGMRIVVELKRNVDVDLVLNKLYKHTDLQYNFNVNMIALVDGEPMLLNLKQIIDYYIIHQRGVITRRTRFDLDKATDRIHILEGLLVALENIDNIIKIIKNSKNVEESREKLSLEYNLSHRQSQAILDIRLQRLTSLEINKVKAEHAELLKDIEFYKSVLNNPKTLNDVLKKEIKDIGNTHKDLRRTKLIWECETIAITSANEIPNYNVVFYSTKDGYLKKIPSTSLRSSKENLIKEGDVIIGEISGDNMSEVLVFTDKGVCYKKRAYEIPDSKPYSLGEYLPSLLQLDSDEKVIHIAVINEFKGYMIFAFKNGKVAKIDISAYETKQNRSKLVNAYNTDSELLNVCYAPDDIDMLCRSNINKILIFNTGQINPKITRNSGGVQVLRSKNDSYMDLCISTDMVDGITDLNYYKGSVSAIGSYLKKCDKVIMKK